MIEISLNTAVLFYGFVIAIGLGSSWLFTEFAAARTYTALSEQDLWKCHFCTFSYLDRSGLRVSRCPRCQSFNVNETDGADVPDALLADVGEDGIARRKASRRKRPGARSRGPRRRR